MMRGVNRSKNFYYLLNKYDCFKCRSTRLKTINGIYKLDIENNKFISDKSFNDIKIRKLFNIGLSNIISCPNCYKLFNVFNISYDSVLSHKKMKGFIIGPFGVGIDNFALYDYTVKEREQYLRSLLGRLEKCFRCWRKHYMSPFYCKLMAGLVFDTNRKYSKVLNNLKELTYTLVEFISNVRKHVFNENMFISMFEYDGNYLKENKESIFTFCNFSEFKENSNRLNKFSRAVHLQLYAPGQSKQSEFNLELIDNGDNVIVFFECNYGLKVYKNTDFQAARSAFLTYHNEIVFPQVRVKNKDKFILINEVMLWKLAWSSIFQSTFCLW
jgi:hypothetical protein